MSNTSNELKSLFRDLGPEEEEEFRKWARENYKPFDPIKGVWHPIVQEECVKMNKETKLDLDGLVETTFSCFIETLE